MDKSGDISQDLSDFITDIQNGADPANETPVRGLLFVEAALNFNVTKYDIEAEYQKLYSKGISTTAFDGSSVSGADMAALYQAVYDKIDAIADTAQLLGSGSIYVTGIDISFDTASLTTDAAVVFTLGRSSSSGNCYTDGDYSILDRNIGPCNDHSNPGSRTGENAADQVSRLVGSRCNTNVNRGCAFLPPYQLGTWYNVRTIPDPNSSTYNTDKNYYLTHNSNECVTEQDINTTIAAIKKYQTNNYPITITLGHNYYIPNVDVTIKNSFAKNWNWSVSHQNPQSTTHNYSIKGVIMDGQCVGMLISKPNVPSW